MGCGDIFRSCLPLKKTKLNLENARAKQLGNCFDFGKKKRASHGSCLHQLGKAKPRCPALRATDVSLERPTEGQQMATSTPRSTWLTKKRSDIIQERIEKLKKYDERKQAVDERRAELKRQREEHLKKKHDLAENNVRGLKISRVHRRQKAAKEKDVVVPGAVYDHEDDYPKATTSNATVATSANALSSNSSLSTLSVYSSSGEEESWEAWEERIDDELFYA